MRKEEVFLTTFETIQTHGFITIMLLIWGGALVVGVPTLYLLNKTKYKSHRTR